MEELLRRAWAVFRQVAAYTAIVVGAIPQLNLPNAVRAPLIAIGGAILTIEHYVQTQVPTTTASTPAAVVPPPAPATSPGVVQAPAAASAP